MKRQIAFIDEFGNNGLDFSKTGTTTHFIVTAVVIDQDYLKDAEEAIDTIRKSHFQTGEMKSANIADNETRRLKLLRDLSSLNYHIFSFVIDKRELKSEGFTYKGSFYKFLHSLVDRELFRTFPDILIVADEHGSEEFKEGFIKYMHNRHIPDLFQQSEFKLSNSKSELLVQLSDIISGTLARCFDETKMSSRKSELLSAIKDKIIEIREWPSNDKSLAYNPGKDRTNFNIQISELGLTLANQFLKENKKSKIPYEQDQSTCLSFLVFHFKHINPETYVSTAELMEHIISARGSKISIHYFRSRLIAKLRDKGVLVASSSKGYKLPSSTSDLYDFINHSNSYIQPMIDRVIKCRNQIRLATKNDIDILDHEEFKYLKILKDTK